MTKFYLEAEVEKTVLDTVTLIVEADDLEEAFDLAEEAITEQKATPEVRNMYVEDRAVLEVDLNWIRVQEPDEDDDEDEEDLND